jgi:hypothetical protein
MIDLSAHYVESITAEEPRLLSTGITARTVVIGVRDFPWPVRLTLFSDNPAALDIVDMTDLITAPEDV